jgi:GT2 family glycosyltransferase
MNTPRRRLFASRRAIEAAGLVGAKPIRTGSFVSMLVDAAAIKRHGLPRADYFLWNDDMEFAARLLRHGQGIYVPGSVAEHHTPRFAGSMDNPGERFYFEVRNKTWTFAWGGDFGPLDLAAYGAYTLYGWAKVLLTGQDRAVLWRCLARGLRDGLRRPPRSTAAVMAHLGPVSAEIRGVEAQSRAATPDPQP